MPDEQDRAEALDEDAEPVVAPDRPLGSQAYGAAGAEPHADEPIARRAAREEPEERPGDRSSDAPPDEPGPATDDVATERAAPPPAEEDAMHVERVPSEDQERP